MQQESPPDSETQAMIQELNALGWESLMGKETDKAIDHFVNALTIAGARRANWSEFDILTYLGIAHTWKDQPEQGIQYHKQAFATAHEIGDTLRES